ncbi:MAG: response regulator transcription factor [Bacteroidota bacterium]|nr:response regulator transcription factor [Bacteroidota bacterium]MDP4251644.1 response regulator transcription factor [Bacteroidota bacterium]
MKVLIIEDEKSMALEMESFLNKLSYNCELAFNARQAREKMLDQTFSFILLDLGLPDQDGLLVLKEARSCCPDASYIILTARGNVQDRIKGLDLGADDYLPKPFSLPELHARMQAIIRRKAGLKDNAIQIEEFTIDLSKRTVSCSGEEILLSRKEFDLLGFLLLNKNRPLTRFQLSEHIRGDFGGEDYDSNYIDVHIKNIRKKLSVFGSADWLQTLRGVGYKIKA